MITPMPGKVLIKLQEKEEKTKAGLYIPDALQEKALGVGLCMTGEFEGKTVYFKRYAGDEITDEGVNYIVVDEDDLEAVVED